jgi:putative PIN family toxin of toxin-antitoxin system
MRPLKAVIDSNVLHAGLYSSSGASYQVLRAVVRGKLRPVLSTTLLFEYEDLLKRHQTMLRLSSREIDELLDDLCSRSAHQRVYFLWRPQLSDPKDDHLLELAVASQTALIVTHNTRHFREAKAFGISAITPCGIS